MTNEQIKELNNEALLDILVEAYITKQEYQYRADYIKWTQELENEVVNEYWNLYHEALRRMEEN
jgi:hypothetical protein